MNRILANSVRAFTLLPNHGVQANAVHSLVLEQSMTEQHFCPCCSYPLLRHICLGEVIWKCDHCYTDVGVYVRSQSIVSSQSLVSAQQLAPSQQLAQPRKKAQRRPIVIRLSKRRDFLFSHITNQRQLAMNIVRHRLRLARTQGLILTKLTH